MSDLGEEDVCDVGYEAPPSIPCNCTKLSGRKCNGTLKFDITNHAVAFLECDKCGCCYHADKIKAPEPKADAKHFDEPTKSCYEYGCVEECPIGGRPEYRLQKYRLPMMDDTSELVVTLGGAVAQARLELRHLQIKVKDKRAYLKKLESQLEVAMERARRALIRKQHGG